MVARAIWKATLRIGGEQLPVRLCSAVQEQSIRFHLLHKTKHERVRQRMVHPQTLETVDMADARRGVEVERGVFVMLEEDEIAGLEPEASRDIEITRFVPREAIDPYWYERPYWLAPDEGDEDRYFALVQALEQTGRQGVARWSMRKNNYVGALQAVDGYLALVSLRHAGEVIPLAELQPPAGRGIEERERKLASQLVAALSSEFDPGEFKEEYRGRVLQLVAAKRKGKRVRLQRFEPKLVRDDSLANALERSLKAA